MFDGMQMHCFVDGQKKDNLRQNDFRLWLWWCDFPPSVDEQEELKFVKRVYRRDRKIPFDLLYAAHQRLQVPKREE